MYWLFILKIYYGVYSRGFLCFCQYIFEAILEMYRASTHKYQTKNDKEYI